MERKEKIRKTYIKPEISQVKLVPEEAVLLSCKTAAGDKSGPQPKHCTHTQCQTAGS